VFCRLLDKDKGGYFSIHPQPDLSCTTKQQYLPSSNILQTRYIHEQGVVDIVDFFPRPKQSNIIPKGGPRQSAYREATAVQEELKQWLVRRVECIRGKLALDVEIFPAFDYALEPHETTIVQPIHDPGSPDSKTVTFHSKNLKLQLDVTIDKGEEDVDTCPSVIFKRVKRPGMLGEGVVARILVQEGQAISFVLRNDIDNHVTNHITSAVLDLQQHDTQTYWYNWIAKSKYKGRWREVVARSLLILKLMTYEPTGAIIASPTFSIPEDVGGVRLVSPLLCSATPNAKDTARTNARE
jgi:GH15 family glucan-1,4-alpha-glucosidase